MHRMFQHISASVPRSRSSASDASEPTARIQNGMRQPDPQNAHAAQIKQLPFRIPGIANQAQEEFVRQSLLVTLAKKSDPKPLSDLDSIILKQIQARAYFTSGAVPRLTICSCVRVGCVQIR